MPVDGHCPSRRSDGIGPIQRLPSNVPSSDTRSVPTGCFGICVPHKSDCHQRDPTAPWRKPGAPVGQPPTRPVWRQCGAAASSRFPPDHGRARYEGDAPVPGAPVSCTNSLHLPDRSEGREGDQPGERFDRTATVRAAARCSLIVTSKFVTSSCESYQLLSPEGTVDSFTDSDRQHCVPPLSPILSVPQSSDSPITVYEAHRTQWKRRTVNSLIFPSHQHDVPKSSPIISAAIDYHQP